MAPIANHLIPPCPEPGLGVHNWLMHAGWACRKAGLSSDDAISEINSRISRPPRWREIEDAVEKAYSTTVEGKGRVFRPISAVYNRAKLKKLADRLDSFGVDELREKSVYHPDECTAEEFLNSLYLPGERVLIFDEFQSQGQYLWKRPSDGVEFDPDELDCFEQPAPGNGVWFIVNPVNGEYSKNERTKKLSRRSEEDLTDYRYLLLESDEVPENLWIRALVQLPLPIVSVCSSGGRSIHSLIRVNAPSGEIWREQVAQIASPLLELGACKGTRSPAQLSRLPRCFRAVNQQWQQLLYINPNADGTPICEL